MRTSNEGSDPRSLREPAWELQVAQSQGPDGRLEPALSLRTGDLGSDSALLASLFPFVTWVQ